MQSGRCSNITDYFSTRNIATPCRRNTHTYSPIQNKAALAKSRTHETVSIGKTYEASNIHIKQLRAMGNNNNVDNTNIQAIRTLTHSTRSNKCLKCGKSHAFYLEACPVVLKPTNILTPTTTIYYMVAAGVIKKYI